MDKRSFLKATGITFIASLLAFGRRADDGGASVASAQDDNDLAKRVAELAERYADIEKRCGRYETQLRLLQANDGTLEERLDGHDARFNSLSLSFVGAIVAILNEKDEIPYGWHLCDGTPIPDTAEFQELRKRLHTDCFPDFRGVFLRGLDEVATDGSSPTWRDPDYIERNKDKEPIGSKRKIGEEQKSANLGHNHPCSKDGKHLHNIGPTDVGKVYVNPDKGHFKTVHRTGTSQTSSEFVRPGIGTYHLKVASFLTIAPAEHTHPCIDDDKSKHNHSILKDSDSQESRPVNVSVRYIIRYA